MPLVHSSECLQREHWCRTAAAVILFLLRSLCKQGVTHLSKSHTGAQLSWDLMTVKPITYNSHHFHTHQPIQWAPVTCAEDSAIVMFLHSFIFFHLSLSVCMCECVFLPSMQPLMPVHFTETKLSTYRDLKLDLDLDSEHPMCCYNLKMIWCLV